MADVAIDLYVGSCVLSRLDHMLMNKPANGSQVVYNAEVEAGKQFLRIAFRRIDGNIKALYRNDDDGTTKAANAALARW